MDENKLRAWWAAKQGLDGSLGGLPPSEVLARTGWARSVGGAAPYLTLHARAATRRDAVDEAAGRVDICELPEARGCTYVVPATDFAVALKAGQACAVREMRAARKLGVTDLEIDCLSEAVVSALTGAELRESLQSEPAGRPTSGIDPQLPPVVRNPGARCAL